MQRPTYIVWEWLAPSHPDQPVYVGHGPGITPWTLWNHRKYSHLTFLASLPRMPRFGYYTYLRPSLSREGAAIMAAARVEELRSWGYPLPWNLSPRGKAPLPVRRALGGSVQTFASVRNASQQTGLSRTEIRRCILEGSLDCAGAFWTPDPDHYAAMLAADNPECCPLCRATKIA